MVAGMENVTVGKLAALVLAELIGGMEAAVAGARGGVAGRVGGSRRSKV